MVPVVDTVLIPARLVDGLSHYGLRKIKSSDKGIQTLQSEGS